MKKLEGLDSLKSKTRKAKKQKRTAKELALVTMLLHDIWLLLFYLPIASTFGKTIKVLTTEEDVAKFSDGSGARLKDGPVVDLVDVTVCLRFYTFLLVERQDIISSNEDQMGSPIFAINYYYPGNKWYSFHGRWIKLPKNIDWPIMTWNHICWNFDNETGIIRLVSNGDVALDEID